ncbi:MAG: Unknown protein [uncultured Sulfurovum sp.]|uniref:Uncharacterized protein n=1 Tax=uncultured Sulfurovum sp. TaxID=269237 RepID=A0A6S6TGQ3_9BACT|nr:MAG: Unknown protein [uncultured Sulfurovum sp.]
MTITLNIQNEQLFNRILWLLSRFKNDGLEIITDIQQNISTPTEPKNKFSEFAGIWKDRDITQESIREQAWR